ncbi:hypothetical protein ACHQM5_009611 [Ranunculus cassubicifolius]
MVHISVSHIISLLFLQCFITSSLSQDYKVEHKVLNVGKELQKEILPLKSGSGIYELRGIKSSTWYEVKISYPASIPSSFSIQLMRDKSEIGLNLKRKLLNTEKLIFKADESIKPMYVLVSVEPEGVVAVPGASEREFAMFNIVCDELVLGIPHKAWLVVGFAILCLLLAFVAPIFLGQKYQSLCSADPIIMKDS